MTLFIRDLADYIEEAGIATIGTDMFVGELPAEPNNAIMLVNIISPPPDEYLPTQTQDFEVWARNSSPADAATKLQRVFNLLHRNHHITLGDKQVYFIQAQGNIDDLDKDSEGRKLLRIMFRAIYRDVNTVS